MAPARRTLLKGIGAGLAIGLLGTPVTAGSTERLFVHPRVGALGDVLDAIDAVGGATVFEYDNFDFVAAEIPTERLETLRSDVRVSHLEEDDDVGVPSGWLPSILNILAPGGQTDCSLHPDQSPSWGWERIGAEGVEPDGSGVDVAILDTGIYSDHCSLSVSGGRNFTGVAAGDYEDRHGHGSHVAGIVGALDNDLGVVGVAPAVNLYAVKVLDDDGDGSHSTLVAGIDWCISHDIELISMSLGGAASSDAVDRAIETAHEAGHLLLAAAGNTDNAGDGTCDEENMRYPATHADVVGVTAMNRDDTLASYSSVGTGIDLLAPGTDIDSTYADNRYARASGTSAACPFVTGVAALCWQRSEAIGPGPNERVRERLRATAETVLGTCEEGAGLVDARAAASEAVPPPDDDAEATDDEPPDQSGTDDGEHVGGLADRGESVFSRVFTLLRRFFEWIASIFR